MRNGSEANTVPASERCRPSTRMSFSTNGVTAHAEPTCKAAASAIQRTVGRRKDERGEDETGRVRMQYSVQAQNSGHIVVESEGRHHEHDGHSTALQPLEPRIRERPPCHRFKKIIHQVSAIKH